MLRKRMRDKIRAMPSSRSTSRSQPSIAAKVENTLAIQMEDKPVENASTDENSTNLFLKALGIETVARHFAKCINADTTRSLMYTSKQMYHTYLPKAKSKLYFKATPPNLTEKEARRMLKYASSPLENLHVNMDNCYMRAVFPLLEMFGTRLKKLLIQDSGGQGLSMSKFLQGLRLVPNLERIELHVVEMCGYGSLAGFKKMPLLENVREISLKRIIPSIFYNGLWKSNSYRALADLIIVCPNLQQLTLHADSLSVIFIHHFIIRYLYLRCGIVFDYANVCKDNNLIYFPVRRENNYCVNLGDPRYLKKFLRRRDRKFWKTDRMMYRGDQTEWQKSGVSAPPNFSSSLAPQELQRVQNSGFLFANDVQNTELFTSDDNDSTSEESEEDDEVTRRVFNDPNSTQGERCLCQ